MFQYFADSPDEVKKTTILESIGNYFREFGTAVAKDKDDARRIVMDMIASAAT